MLIYFKAVTGAAAAQLYVLFIEDFPWCLVMLSQCLVVVAASPGTSAAATFGATQAGFRLHEYLRSNTTPLTNIYTGDNRAWPVLLLNCRCSSQG